MKRILVISFVLCALLGFGQTKKTRILFVLDASGSMQNLWSGQSRMSVAKEVLLEIATKLDVDPKVEIALRVYGHQFVDNCKDTRLEVGFNPNNLPTIKEKLNRIKAKGTTPITYTLQKAAGDFPLKVSDSRNIVILITDGVESCEGDPCATALALQEKGVFLKPFVIGLGISDKDYSTLDCMGNFYNVTSKESFKSVFQSIIDKSLSDTKVQVKLLDQSKRPTETDVNMTFYDTETGAVKYNYYHTMNHRGKPDTINLDPVNTYSMTVHTLPEVKKKGIVLEGGKNNVIIKSAPQGYFELKLQGETVHQSIDNKIRCLVRKGNKTLEVQEVKQRKKYLTGTYDLEILTIPTIKQKIKISADKTSSIEVPAPGLLTITHNYPGYGGIYMYQGDKLVEVYELKQKNNREVIALQPGQYHIIYRTKNAKKAEYTKEKKITITSFKSTSITF